MEFVDIVIIILLTLNLLVSLDDFYKNRKDAKDLEAMYFDCIKRVNKVAAQFENRNNNRFL